MKHNKVRCCNLIKTIKMSNYIINERFTQIFKCSLYEEARVTPLSPTLFTENFKIIIMLKIKTNNRNRIRYSFVLY